MSSQLSSSTSSLPPPVPKYSHPFSLAELEELDLHLLSQEIQRLQKSLSLLQSTNQTLLRSLAIDSPFSAPPPSAPSSFSSFTSPSPQSPSVLAQSTRNDNNSNNDDDIDPPSTAEERAEYEAIVDENEESMKAQSERIELCKWAIMKRLGRTESDGGNRHYALENDMGGIVSSSSRSSSGTTGNSHRTDDGTSTNMTAASSSRESGITSGGQEWQGLPSNESGTHRGDERETHGDRNVEHVRVSAQDDQEGMYL